MIENGHIGYGIRPRFRGKGYVTKILALSLKKVKGFGVREALLTCDKENTASKKVIIKNGGILGREQVINGKKY